MHDGVDPRHGRGVEHAGSGVPADFVGLPPGRAAHQTDHRVPIDSERGRDRTADQPARRRDENPHHSITTCSPNLAASHFKYVSIVPVYPTMKRAAKRKI